MGKSKKVSRRSKANAPPAKRVEVKDTKLSSSLNTAAKGNQDAKLDVKPIVQELQAAAGTAAATASPDISYMRRKELRIKDALCHAEPMSAVDNYVNKVLVVEKRSVQKGSESRAAKVVSKKYKCKNCDNKNQNRFAENTSEGHVTCRDCGVVALDHKIHEGEWKRRFEGDVNPSFHGPGMKRQCERALIVH
jgi:DNA-directed RNA polymerase subunit RPC12/RpoP